MTSNIGKLHKFLNERSINYFDKNINRQFNKYIMNQSKWFIKRNPVPKGYEWNFNCYYDIVISDNLKNQKEQHQEKIKKIKEDLDQFKLRHQEKMQKIKDKMQKNKEEHLKRMKEIKEQHQTKIQKQVHYQWTYDDLSNDEKQKYTEFIMEKVMNIIEKTEHTANNEWRYEYGNNKETDPESFPKIQSVVIDFLIEYWHDNFTWSGAFNIIKKFGKAYWNGIKEGLNKKN